MASHSLILLVYYNNFTQHGPAIRATTAPKVQNNSMMGIQSK